MVLDFVENCFMVIVCLHISNLQVTRGLFLCSEQDFHYDNEAPLIISME